MNPAPDLAARILAGVSRPSADARGLPAIAYTDPGFAARERETMYEAGWASVGFAQQIPDPGDVRPATAAGRPLLLTRDRHGEVHVFHNVCRHRGLKLVCEAGTHRNGLLTCPYHSWSYGLDGALAAAPYWDRSAGSAPNEATRASFGLLPVRSAVWFDTVFVNLSGDAAPFEDYIAPLAAHWRPFDLSLLRLVDTVDYLVPANWKFACENFLDSYHLPWVHPQLGPPETAYDIELTVLSEDVFGFVMPRFDAARDQFPPVPPLFPGLPEEFEYALNLICLFPNTLVLLTAGWAQVISLEPQSPGETRELLAGYLVGDAALTEAYADYRAGFMDLLRQVNGQDIEILTRLHAGRCGDAADAGRFAPAWDTLGLTLARRIARAY
jgi:choline monooxygenase